MGEYRAQDCQALEVATCIRDRMDHLYNNSDMSDLHIVAADEAWWWGQTVKDFIGHKFILSAASPIFHQLFYPQEDGPNVPSCLKLCQGQEQQKLEVDGIPPIAMEALLEYLYKDRFNRADFENGYSRNLLWRLWHASKMFEVKHLFELCTETLDDTMCEETVFWDLNYSMVYEDIGTENIRKKVVRLMESLTNSLYEHQNLVWLDHNAIRELLKRRKPSSSDPLIVLNNILRWAFYQLDRNFCDEVDGRKDSEITLTERIKCLHKIRNGEIEDYSYKDIQKYLNRVVDLVPWTEFSQQEFLQYVVPAKYLEQEMLISTALSIMEEVVKNPERLAKSSYVYANDPNKIDTELRRAMVRSPVAAKMDDSMEQEIEKIQNPKPMANIRSSLEAARLRRLNSGKRGSLVVDSDLPKNGNDLLLIDG